MIKQNLLIRYLVILMNQFIQYLFRMNKFKVIKIKQHQI